MSAQRLSAERAPTPCQPRPSYGGRGTPVTRREREQGRAAPCYAAAAARIWSPEELARVNGIRDRLARLLNPDGRRELDRIVSEFTGHGEEQDGPRGPGDAEAGNARGRMFELRMLDRLSDAHLASLEFERPVARRHGPCVDLFFPKEALGIELKAAEQYLIPRPDERLP